MAACVRQWGEIEGDPVGLFPCLWLGLIDNNGVVPWWKEDWWQPGKQAPPGSPDRYASQLKPGQFVFLHQYQGLLCAHLTLAGVILPFSTCADSMVKSALLGLTEKYFDDPWAKWEPNIDELAQLRDDLLKVGPLDSTNCFRHSGEAFLTFACSQHAYQWIADRFEMVTEVLDNERATLVEIRKTGKLPAAQLSDFAGWMSGPGGACHEWHIIGALVYENSD